MRVRWYGSVVLAITWLVAGSGTAAPRDRADTTKAKSPEALLAEGDRLADRGAYGEAVLRYKEAYEQIVPRLRKLVFKHDVPARVLDRDALREALVEEVEEELDEAALRLTDRALKAFGFVPKDLDTKALMMDLLTEEIGGYYDPKDKRISMVREVEKPAEEKPRGLWERLFGAPPAFDKDEQKAALAHEMAHALADQHFDLEALQESVKDDDDQSLALSALIEGEAMIVMMQELAREGGGDGQHVLRLPPAYLDFTLSVVQGFLPFVSGESFRRAPPIFRESMMFPYFKGMVFVLHLTNVDGWTLVNEAFRDPPTSTEQILHPEKFRGPDRDEPLSVTLPRLEDAVGETWEKVGENVLGELQLRVLLRRHHGKVAAAGWGGDRFAIFEDNDDRLGLAWRSTWDAPHEAQEFAASYTRFLRAKLGVQDDADVVLPEDASPGGPHTQTRYRLVTGGRAYHVQRTGRDVAVVEGFTRPETDALVVLLLRAETKPKRFQRVGKGR